MGIINSRIAGMEKHKAVMVTAAKSVGRHQMKNC